MYIAYSFMIFALISSVVTFTFGGSDADEWAAVRAGEYQNKPTPAERRKLGLVRGCVVSGQVTVTSPALLVQKTICRPSLVRV